MGRGGEGGGNEGIYFHFLTNIHVWRGFIPNQIKIGLCPNDGHADPFKKDHLKKVVMNGAECSEKNGKNNKKILRFYFSSYGHFSVIFVKKSPQNTPHHS